MVNISVQVMGGTRKLFLEVAEDITVAELRRVVARTSGTREAHRLKLIAHGCALRDEDGAARLAEGAALLAVTAPLPPPQAAQAQADAPPAERDADAVRFELPADASPWARRAAAFCQQRLHLPEMLMVVLFSVQPWVWCAAAAWLAGAPIAHRLEAACRPARAPQCAAAPAGMAAGPCLAAPAAPAGAAIAAALPPPQLDCASPRGALEGPPPAGTSAHALRAALASAAPPLTGEPVAEGAPSAALLPAAALSPGAPGGGCTPRHKRSPSGTGADWRAWEACSQSASA